MISITQRKPSRTITKSTLFTVSKDEWNTKEGTGRMHTYRGMPKDTSRAEAMSNNEKTKPVALAVIELCWSEGIGCQSVENLLKF